MLGWRNVNDTSWLESEKTDSVIRLQKLPLVSLNVMNLDVRWNMRLWYYFDSLLEIRHYLWTKELFFFPYQKMATMADAGEKIRNDHKRCECFTFAFPEFLVNFHSSTVKMQRIIQPSNELLSINKLFWNDCFQWQIRLFV